MSYAGFQRSEVPQIGEKVAGIMQHQLDTQAKEDAQQKALIAKGIAQQQKQQKEEDKSNIEASKPLYDALNKVPSTPYIGLNQIGNMLTNSTKTAMASVINDKSLNPVQKANEGHGLGVAVNSLSTVFNDFNKASDNVVAMGDNVPPMTKFVFDKTKKDLSDPNEYATSFNKIGDATYNLSAVRHSDGENIFDGNIGRNLIALSTVKPIDYNAAYKTIVSNVGDVAIMNPLKGGGTELRIDEANSEKFINERDTAIKKILSNQNELGNAMYYNLNGVPMLDDKNNTYKVALIPTNASDDDKKRIMDEMGSKNGNDMIFVKVEQDKNGLPIAKPTDAQKEILENVIKNRFENLAMDKYSINKPNITNVNVNSNEKKESATITRVRLGDENAIKDMVAQIPTRKLTIGATNSKGDGKSYIYDPENKLLTLDIIDKEAKPKYDSNGDIIPEDNTRTFDLNYEPDMEYLMRLLNEPELQKVGKYSPKKR